MDLKIQVETIQNKILNYQKAGYRLCISSSFQTHSLSLLHIVTQAIPDLPVLFIDTGYHFPETYAFRNQITQEWQLNLINVQSKTPKNQQVDTNGQFLYATDPEYCCVINKVEPLNEALLQYDVWIAGLRRDQTKFREDLQEEVFQENGILKYHPILNWNSKMIYEYAKQNNLPRHPLEDKGYFSIGCMPCTTSVSEDMERSGRWFGSKKTECGIHLTKS
ncbi:MAG: phosphoadenylyl-sulfate reductase [Flavobacteriaceae bacterium]|nr:phosphoadenylyl-sulfate reductase [Flavobacteriaceae bacterium]